jgi:outer membrane protein insertion porin family
VTSDFSTTSITAGLTWGMPVTNLQTVRFGFRYKKSELLLNDFSSSLQAKEWVLGNGESFRPFPGSSTFGTRIETVDLIAGWSFEARNRTLFPDEGMRASLDLQAVIPGSDVEYYLATLNVEKFFPITRRLRIRINSELNVGDAYGDETTALPPYENFFGGGPNSVRGFKENYLGPRDSFGNPNGGNMSFINQFELILPTPGKLGSNARMSLFYDVGGVFHTGGVDFFDRLGDRLDTDFSSDKLKSSYGFGVQWLSPMGLLQFSYAIPVNKDKETDRYFSDQTEGFQFTIGQAF